MSGLTKARRIREFPSYASSTENGEHETGNYGRYRFPILKERKMKMKHGSRSALIVPLESRETNPGEPVSREGDASYYGIGVEKHSLHQEVKIWL